VNVAIVGAGIGGLTTALLLHRRGIPCRVYEQAPAVRELGVGINMLPHAVRELRDLGLLQGLDAAGVRTHELFYLNRQGQEVWHELRGTGAGHDVPQFSIHRGLLQRVIHDAVVERLGPRAVRTDCRLDRFESTRRGVVARFRDRSGADAGSVEADVLVGADGIRSTVRAALFPDEGPPRWNGAILWRGAREWPAFLTGRSMLIAGGMREKVVVYPIGAGSDEDTRLTNWAVIGQTGHGTAPPPRREDWSRVGRWEELEPFLERFAVPQVDVRELIGGTPVFYEYPMCDRDPLPAWTHGRVTLLGDAAHPMYPVGSNGASQAILDARSLADSLATRPLDQALHDYEQERLPATADIVRSNRTGGPEGVIDAVEALAPHGFDDVDAVLPYGEREAIVRGYARKAGFAVPQRDPAASTRAQGGRMSETWGASVTRADAGADGISWSILGQIYVPKHVDERSFTWHATLPPGTFVPPHLHRAQDEFIYMLGGTLELELDGAPDAAHAGDLIRLPMGVPHGLFNRSDGTVTCVFWVTPTRKLYDLFAGIDAMAEQTPDEVVALSAEHEVDFLPPPG
jgi:2-polyprenyl-6-methoxyphenol hydroxylase-like FAD-dependent oxidoreductase/quercetin dioxygenase-like cupin family protein